MNSRLITVLAACLPMVACVAEDPGALLVVGNQEVTLQTNCTFRVVASANIPTVSVGTMDLLQTNRFVIFPMVKNNLPESMTALGLSEQNLAVEMNGIQIHGAWITYEIQGLEGPFFGDEGYDLDNDGTPDFEGNIELPDKIYVPTTGFAEPDTSTTFALEVIPPSVGNVLDMDKAFDNLYDGGILTARIILLGFLTDGTEVESAPFNYPIKVCRGCLVYYNVDPAECCLESSLIGQAPCYPGQDAASPCRLACEMAKDTIRGDQKLKMITGVVDTLAVEQPE